MKLFLRKWLNVPSEEDLENVEYDIASLHERIKKLEKESKNV